MKEQKQKLYNTRWWGVGPVFLCFVLLLLLSFSRAGSLACTSLPLLTPLDPFPSLLFPPLACVFTRRRVVTL